MESGMTLELAKFHIADMLREAEQERLARQVERAERARAIDSVGYRERFWRLLGGLPAIGRNGPRATAT